MLLSDQSVLKLVPMLSVIHAYAMSGGPAAATKAQELLLRMHTMNDAGNHFAKPDTITYNVVINAWAKSGGQGAALETERLLAQMHQLHQAGDRDIKPNVVTYGAVIDSYAKSGEKGAASKADTLLAKMIQLYQSDPITNSDLRPNTYVFNTGGYKLGDWYSTELCIFQQMELTCLFYTSKSLIVGLRVKNLMLPQKRKRCY